MAIIRYPRFTGFPDPFSEMARLKKEMYRLFAGVTGSGSYTATSGVFPAVNIAEDGDKILVQAELPGTRQEDLEISIEGATLTLSGERKTDGDGNVSYHRRERRSGTFKKAITLPYEVNAEGAEAHFKDGVLDLSRC
jgi:HSP20 family protein